MVAISPTLIKNIEHGARLAKATGTCIAPCDGWHLRSLLPQRSTMSTPRQPSHMRILHECRWTPHTPSFSAVWSSTESNDESASSFFRFSVNIIITSSAVWVGSDCLPSAAHACIQYHFQHAMFKHGAFWWSSRGCQQAGGWSTRCSDILVNILVAEPLALSICIEPDPLAVSMCTALDPLGPYNCNAVEPLAPSTCNAECIAADSTVRRYT